MRRATIPLMLIALLLLTPSAQGQSGGGLGLPWWSMDGGGGSAGSDAFRLRATIGQPDAGVSHGGGYVLAGGFWHAAIPTTTPGTHLIYLPLVPSTP